jgi:hypothetical protein
MALNDFLMWLVGSAGASAVASWVLERIPAYAKIAVAETKRWIFFGACVILSIGAYVVVTYVPASFLESLAPFFGLVAATFISVFTGSGFHKIDKIDKPQG